MSKVAIMADTTVQMNPRMSNAHNIKLVPLYITIDGKSYPENEIDLPWFYSQMSQWETNDLPLTSAPSTGDFLKAYRDLSQHSEAVLNICLSSKFSTTFSAALAAQRLASEETPQIPFVTIDTQTVCGAQMLIALEAARAAAEGKGLDEVRNLANEMVKRVNCISLSPDLAYLARGGRIHRGRAWAGSKVASTALLEASYASEGANRPLGTRHRNRSEAIKSLFQTVLERSPGQRLHVAINHTDAPQEAEELKEMALAEFSCAEVFITPILPLVAVHNGLGALKFSWWGEG